jgi:16S rRNA (guanine527-N7)-methyltransferase
VIEPADPAELLRVGLERLEVPEPQRVRRLLESYMAEISRWNERFGLVKYDGPRELVVKHVLDSLSAWRIMRELAADGTGTVLDVGSGAGLPGIPLAIALPGVAFTLLERMAKRAAFLKTSVILLGLAHVQAVQGDLVDVQGDFDVVTFRAVAPLERLLPALDRIRWRAVAAYKGREERVREEMEGVRRLAEDRFDIDLRSLQTPFLDEERWLAVVTRRPLLTNG